MSVVQQLCSKLYRYTATAHSDQSNRPVIVIIIIIIISIAPYGRNFGGAGVALGRSEQIESAEK